MRARGLLTRHAILLSFAALSLGGTCDRTRIEGSIRPSEVRVEPGESTTLELTVVGGVSARTHREFWVVDPESLGTITASAPSARHATFEAKSRGRGTITAFAYYRPQTSPQPVARVSVTVE